MAGADTHWHYGEVLRQCRSYLVEEYTILPEVQGLVHLLYEGEHITHNQRQNVMETVLTTNKMETLLAILIRKSDAASYECVKQKLNESNHYDIVDKLNATMERVKLLPKPQEENVQEMARRVKKGIMNHNIQMSEVINCLSMVADCVTPEVQPEKVSTSAQHQGTQASTGEDADTPEGAFERLMEASKNGNAKTVRRILARNPQCINHTNNNGETPLMVACRHANIGAIKELLICKDININMRDVNGRTALMFCMLSSDSEALSVLLQAQVDLTICDNDELKYIWYLFGSDIAQYLSILGLLIERGNEALKEFAIYEVHILGYIQKLKELKNRIDNWPAITNIIKYLLSNSNVDHNELIKASLTLGNCEVLDVIVDSGKTVTDEKSITDYCYAIASTVNPGIINELIKHGMLNLANLTPAELDTLVESVIRYNCPKLCGRMSKLVQDLEVSEALRTTLIYQATPPDIWGTALDPSKFDMNVRDRSGNSVAHLLCKYGSEDTVAEVVKRSDVDFSVENDNGQTFLMLTLMNGNENVSKMLLDNDIVNMGINDCDKYLTSTLNYACESNNTHIVKYLVDNSMIDVNIQDKRGRTVLMNVCSQGCGFMNTLLGEEGIMRSFVQEKLNFTNARKRSSKMTSRIYRNNTEIVTILLTCEKTNINLHTSGGYPLLWYACLGGNVRIVSQLIEQGVNVNEVFRDGETTLMMVSGECSSDIVSLLLNANADINAASNNGRTVLSTACAYGNTEVVRLLLRANVDVNVPACAYLSGKTILNEACSRKYVEIVTLLINAKVDVNMVDDKGFRAIFCAVGVPQQVELRFKEEKGTLLSDSICEALSSGNAEILQLLIAAKADVNVSDPEGWTPLMDACLNENPEMVKILLRSNADVNMTTDKGNTALTLACQPGKEMALKELLTAKNLNINADIEVSRCPALALACYHNQPKAVAILLEHNADRNISFEGIPLLRWVKDHGYTEVANVLKNRAVATNTTSSKKKNKKKSK